jgi:hypothetical protein
MTSVFCSFVIAGLAPAIYLSKGYNPFSTEGDAKRRIRWKLAHQPNHIAIGAMRLICTFIEFTA